MYGTGKVLGSTAVTTSGAILLPSTGGNTLGTVLAYVAITIGVVALVSQIAVRVTKRIYR